MHRIGRPHLYTALILALILESSFMNLISIGGVRPNITLIFVVFIGLYSDWRESIETAIAAGLLRDAMGAGPTGANLIAFGICALFVSYCRNKIFKERFLPQVILTAFIAVNFYILTFLIRMIFGNTGLAGTDYMPSFIFNIISPALFTAVLAPASFFFLKRIFNVEELEF